MINDQHNRQPVDPARLAGGQWCHRADKTIGQGDINASYSADRIGMGQPIRKPFAWHGGLWVCVGNWYRGPDNLAAEAYRLVHPSIFDGEPVTYGEKTRDGDAARADPNGFYHGMIVKHAGQSFVLSGPPVVFVPGETEQLSLL